MTSSQKKALKTNLIGYSFVVPNFIGYFIFIFIPVCFSFVLSVMKWDGSDAPMQFVGLENFAKLFRDSTFIISLQNTVWYAVFTVPLTLVAALLIAVLLNSKIKGMVAYRTAFFFPYVASLVAVGAVWNMLFQPEFGPINEFLKWIGIANPPKWCASTDWAMWVIIIVSVWKYMGYYMVVYLAALQGISGDLYEAASIGGATGTKKLWYITIPMLTPTTFYVVIMLSIQCFKVFDLIYIFINSSFGPIENAARTMVYGIYQKAFVHSRMGYASAEAVILFVIILAVTLVQFWGERKWVHYD